MSMSPRLPRARGRAFPVPVSVDTKHELTHNHPVFAPKCIHKDLHTPMLPCEFAH